MKSEQIRPGARIPPEREISRLFGVNRLTTRQAIAELVSEGEIYRIQGSGTYVTKKRAQVLQIVVSE
ncbi:GntR family transcriptional regulator [Candidatus Acetothermia bacterium]|nr:GntR family transcriptional regulator [Candidatus Acetothermia bacterium]